MIVVIRSIIILCLVFIVSDTIAQNLSLQVFDTAKGEEIGSLTVLESQGTKYVLLEEISKLFGGTRKYEPLIGRVTVTMMEKRIVLTLERRQLRINDEEYVLSKPPISISGKVAVPVEFLSRVLPRVIGKHVALDRRSGILQIGEEPPEKKEEQETNLGVPPKPVLGEFRVIIDPGHGGYDVGAKSKTGLLEKDLTLELAQKIEELMAETDGAEVYLTHSEDRYMTAEERINFANNLRGDVFLSIHFNWSPSQNSKGFSLYAYSSRMRMGSDLDMKKSQSSESKGFLSQSKQLAGEIKDRLEGIILTGGKYKEVPLVVMDGLFMPGVLVEVLYLSNPKDLESLSEPDFINSVSMALCDSILAFGSATGEKLGSTSLTQ